MFPDPEKMMELMMPGNLSTGARGHMEKLFIDSMTSMMTDSSFLSSVGKGIEKGLEVKMKTDDILKTYLEKANIPTRDDVARLLQYMVRLESKLLAIEEKLDEMTDPTPQAPKAAGQENHDSTTAGKKHQATGRGGSPGRQKAPAAEAPAQEAKTATRAVPAGRKKTGARASSAAKAGARELSSLKKGGSL